MDDHPLFSLMIERRDPAERRHGGNSESIAAHRKARGKKRYWYVRILTELRKAGSVGRTAKELEKIFGVAINLFSGRCTELVLMGHVRRLAIKRGDSGVLVYRKCCQMAA